MVVLCAVCVTHTARALFLLLQKGIVKASKRYQLFKIKILSVSFSDTFFSMTIRLELVFIKNINIQSLSPLMSSCALRCSLEEDSPETQFLPNAEAILSCVSTPKALLALDAFVGVIAFPVSFARLPL